MDHLPKQLHTTDKQTEPERLKQKSSWNVPPCSSEEAACSTAGDTDATGMG